MNFLRNATKSNISLRAIEPSHGLPFLLRNLPRHFSTDTEQPPPSPSPPPPAGDSSIDPLIQTPNPGLIYGKLFGFAKYTLKTDIINLLEGCNLTLDDVRMSYNRSYSSSGMMVQFSSRQAYDNAIKVLAKKGRLYRLERVDRREWDTTMPYNGKTVLLQGLPLNANLEDVERFLSGCEFDESSIQIFLRQQGSIKMATIYFPSPIQAMNAFITKNRGFFLNNQISVRVLQ